MAWLLNFQRRDSSVLGCDDDDVGSGTVVVVVAVVVVVVVVSHNKVGLKSKGQ